MKDVIKVRRTSARDRPGRAGFPICGVHLHWLACVCPPACGGQAEAACDKAKDVAKMAGNEPVSHQTQRIPS